MTVLFMLATTVVHANQCSSGNVCPSEDEPKNLVLLLQTKLRMNVLDDGPSMLKNPSAMLTEFEGMVRSGETPAFDLISTIKNLIEDDIMPGLQTTRDEAAEATSAALREIQSCNNKSKTKEAGIETTTQVSVENARSVHAACREAQKILHDHNLTDSDAYCVKLGEFLHGATPLELPEGSNRDESVKYVQEASLQNMCDKTKVCELDDGCTAAEAELEDKKAECTANQRSFESEFCTWKTELETNCRNLDTCYSEALAAYESHVYKTRNLVEKWDVETSALHKILCYCNVWLAEKDDCDNRSSHNATQFDVCKDQTYSPILVNYGTPAAKVACSLTSVANHPGTSGFVTQEYDSFTGFVESVVPCAQTLTTEAPTVAGPAYVFAAIGSTFCPAGYGTIIDFETCKLGGMSVDGYTLTWNGYQGINDRDCYDNWPAQGCFAHGSMTLFSSCSSGPLSTPDTDIHTAHKGICARQGR